MNKLIFIDLDGTMLNKNSKIDLKTENIIKLLNKKGHFICIATGRPYRMSNNFYKQLNLKTPMINFNGALIHIPEKKWNKEEEIGINKEIIYDIIINKKKFNLNFIILQNKKKFLIDNLYYKNPDLFNFKLKEKNLLNKNNLIKNPTSIIIGTEKQNIENLIKILNKKYNEYIDIKKWNINNPILELINKGTHKAEAAEKIANFLKIKSSNIIAFGDEQNDKELLKFANLGVAMKNSNNKIKKIANDITEKSNNENGIAIYLKKYFNL